MVILNRQTAQTENNENERMKCVLILLLTREIHDVQDMTSYTHAHSLSYLITWLLVLCGRVRRLRKVRMSSDKGQYFIQFQSRSLEIWGLVPSRIEIIIYSNITLLHRQHQHWLSDIDTLHKHGDIADNQSINQSINPYIRYISHQFWQYIKRILLFHISFRQS